MALATLYEELPFAVTFASFNVMDNPENCIGSRAQKHLIERAKLTIAIYADAVLKRFASTEVAKSSGQVVLRAQVSFPFAEAIGFPVYAAMMRSLFHYVTLPWNFHPAELM